MNPRKNRITKNDKNSKSNNSRLFSLKMKWQLKQERLKRIVKTKEKAPKISNYNSLIRSGGSSVNHDTVSKNKNNNNNNNGVSKHEIIDWIDFLYKDLLTSYVYVGGFYFTFNQIDELFNKMRAIESQIRRVNNTININNSFIKIPLLKDNVAPLEKENKQLLLYKQELLTQVTSKISAIDTQYSKVELTVNYEDLRYIYNSLIYLLDELDTFNSFLLEELQKVKQGEENEFFVYVNDTALELKNALLYGTDNCKKNKKNKNRIEKIINKLPKNK